MEERGRKEDQEEEDVSILVEEEESISLQSCMPTARPPSRDGLASSIAEDSCGMLTQDMGRKTPTRYSSLESYFVLHNRQTGQST